MTILAVVLTVACDPADNVAFENGTDVPLTVYPQGLKVPSTARTLAPRARYTEGMLSERARRDPNVKVWQFAARSPAGEVVFCREYSYAEMQRDQFLVVLRAGVLECP
jgi:hypothetical protein